MRGSRVRSGITRRSGRPSPCAQTDAVQVGLARLEPGAGLEPLPVVRHQADERHRRRAEHAREQDDVVEALLRTACRGWRRRRGQQAGSDHPPEAGRSLMPEAARRNRNSPERSTGDLPPRRASSRATDHRPERGADDFARARGATRCDLCAEVSLHLPWSEETQRVGGLDMAPCDMAEGGYQWIPRSRARYRAEVADRARTSRMV